MKGGAWTFYVKDGDKTLAVINQDTVNHFNLFGNSLFGRYEPSNGARRYYLKDNLGSTRMVTDNNGNILQTFDYYPFGLLMPDRNGGSGSTMEQFTGKELDNVGTQNLNLYYFGARFLDPAIGQWTSVDPLAKKYPGWSPYNYGMDDPIKIIEPNGKIASCCSYYPRSWEDFSLAMNRSIKDIGFKVNNTIKTVEKKAVKTVIYASDKRLFTHPIIREKPLIIRVKWELEWLVSGSLERQYPE